MKAKIIALLILSALPLNALAQSFWLHKQIAGEGASSLPNIVALDSSHFLWVHGVPDFLGVSTDYGSEWSYVLADTPKFPLRIYGLSCYAHPSRTLILVGCNDPKVGHLIRSTDGGITWQDTTLGSSAKGMPGNFIAGMAALDSMHVAVLVCDTLKYMADRLYLSSDGGKRWRTVETPRFHSYGAGGAPGSPEMLYVNDSSLLVAHNALFEDSTTIFQTTDLGASWHKVYHAASMLTRFAFATPSRGFASGIDPHDSQRATIDGTNDGGATWHPVLSKIIVPISTSYYFGSSAGLRSIAFADSLHGIACGAQGLILRTVDGGAHWEEMRSDYTVDAQSADLLTDAAFPDTTHAMIASSDGSVLIYHPGGILDLPNITYPQFTPFTVPKTFDVRWDPVQNATHYAVTLKTSGYPDSTTTVVFKDSVVLTNSIRLTNLVDTSPPPSPKARQYDIYIQALSETNQSNIAQRTFQVRHDSATGAVATRPAEVPSLEVYPNPTRHWLYIGSPNLSYTITDAIGRRWQCPELDSRIDVSKLPSGVYFLHAGRRVARFVKE